MIEKLQTLYQSIIPYDWRPGQLLYRFKCWAWRRYSTVKPRFLGHTWVDRSNLMPHIIFEILSDFIEKECGEDGLVDWYHEDWDQVEIDNKQINVRDEMQKLYDWWHNDYVPCVGHVYDKYYEHNKKHSTDSFVTVEDQPSLSTLVTKYSSKEAEIEDKRLLDEGKKKEYHYEEELNKRLHRVIDIIPYMWT